MSRGSEFRNLSFLAALGLLYYGSYRMAFPFGFADEGYLYYVAHALGQGQLPYQDIRLFSYLPGLFYAFTPLVRWPGEEIQAARTVMMLGLILKTLLFYCCARRFTGVGVACTVALVVLFVPGPWHKFYIGLLGVWILSTVLAYAACPTSWRAVHLGTAVGVTLVLRIDLGIVGSALLAFVLLSAWQDRRSTWRRSLLAPLTAILLHLPLLGFFGFQALLLEYLGQWLRFAGLVARRSSADLRLPPPSPEHLLHFDRLAADAWLYFGALLVVAAYGTVTMVAVVPRLRSPVTNGHAKHAVFETPTPHLLLGLWALGGLPQYAFERPSVAHLTQYSVFFLLPAALLAHRLLRSHATTRWRLPIRACALLLVALFVAKHVFFAQGGSIGVLQRPVHRVTLSNGFEYPAPRAEPLRPLLETILRETMTEDHLVALPFLPGVAFATGRRLLGREVYLVPHSITGPEIEASYVQGLVENPPPFVLYQPGLTFNGQESGRLKAFAPAVDACLGSAFRLREKRFGYFLLEPLHGAHTPQHPATRSPGLDHKAPPPSAPR